MNPARTTIAIFNHKGGVGKTTTSVNLAASLAHVHKKQVLLIDMDAQANATRTLLGKEYPESAPSIRTLLSGDQNTPVRFADTLTSTSIKTLHLIPADIRLSEAEIKLVNRPQREFMLRNILREAHGYDYIIMDCPPSLGILSLNALAAADGVIIPCETAYLSLRGLKYVMELIALVKTKLNPNLQVVGILPTKYYGLSLANQEILQYLLNMRATIPVFSPIGRSVRAEESPNHGLPLILYAPDAPITRQYIDFSLEVITRCQ